MRRFEMRVDPLTHEIYYAVPLKGISLLQDPLLNKGHAFTAMERTELDLHGLLPDMVGALHWQVERNYGIYQMKTSDMERYVTLNGLLDRNETAFYSLVTQHIEETLPIIYTPTVGQACLTLSHIIRRYRGVYVTAANVDRIEDMLRAVGLPEISLLVATDGERILGLGDLGADGMGIPIGKISLYVAAAGIHPASTLPVCLDVGTNNQRLLEDPLYIGVRQPRLTGEAYYDVIERFVQGVRRVFPRALLQWEDIGKHHAFTLLERYRNRIPSFNDDIQGTGATAAAALRGALQACGRPLRDERIAIYGFGQAGSGVANAIVTFLEMEGGVTTEEARRQVYAVDIDGLLMDGMSVTPYQERFRQPREAIAGWPVPKDRAPNLAEVIRHGKITTLIGVSGQCNAFQRELLADLAKNVDRPIVFALSNPTSCSETTPQEVADATAGRALMAAGSPFPPVHLPNGRVFRTSQCNNLYVFPGMGLGAIVCQASSITHRMFHAATCAISDLVTDDERAAGLLLPPLAEIRRVSYHVALAVAKQAREEGLGIAESDERLGELIAAAMWQPRYYPYRYAGC